jgi:hypothetical protein
VKIQILSSTHPDMGTETTVYVDGKRVEDVHVEDIDPGRGYTAEDYAERLRDAQETAARPEATDFEQDLASTLADYGDLFSKYATD